MVSSLSRQGRNQPRLSVAGIPGSTSTALVGREPSGLPKSGTGCVLPLPFQSAKYFRTYCSNILGSPSPAIEITTFSGRYQRSRSEEHTSELQSLMRISYAVVCLKTKQQT